MKGMALQPWYLTAGRGGCGLSSSLLLLLPPPPFFSSLFTSMLFSLCAASSSSRSPPPPLRILACSASRRQLLCLSPFSRVGVCVSFGYQQNETEGSVVPTGSLYTKR
jgi:hypothetical protein